MRGLVLTAAALLVACAPTPRPDRSAGELAVSLAAFEARDRADAEQVSAKFLRRMEAVAEGRLADRTVDVLLLSGGADWGIFGAAFLRAWSERETEPAPQFDLVAGVSTGSLIATYTISGEPERLAQMERFYLDADADFIATSGLIWPLLANSPALTDTRKLEQAVRDAITPQLLAEIAEADAQDRSLLVGAVNLDLGRFDLIDVAAALRDAVEPQERLAKYLLASSAIPALFPPVEIDGELYIDGGASYSIPFLQPAALRATIDGWRARHESAPPPIRIWMIYNTQLALPPEVTALGWWRVLRRSYGMASQTTKTAPLNALRETAAALRAEGLADIEVLWVAVPNSYQASKDYEPFDPTEMQRLRAIGRSLGSNPASWRADAPN